MAKPPCEADVQVAVEASLRDVCVRRLSRGNAMCMMTVVTHVRLKTGCEPDWDAAMRERLSAAQGRPGWIGGQLLIPLDGHNKRTVIGTWVSRADWEAWHEDSTFAETRARMDGLQEGRSEMVWYEVVTEERA